MQGCCSGTLAARQKSNTKHGEDMLNVFFRHWLMDVFPYFPKAGEPDPDAKQELAELVSQR